MVKTITTLPGIVQQFDIHGETVTKLPGIVQEFSFGTVLPGIVQEFEIPLLTMTLDKALELRYHFLDDGREVKIRVAQIQATGMWGIAHAIDTANPGYAGRLPFGTYRIAESDIYEEVLFEVADHPGMIKRWDIANL